MLDFLKTELIRLQYIIDLLLDTVNNYHKIITAQDKIINMLFFGYTLIPVILLFAHYTPDLLEYYQTKKQKRGQNGKI